jgi:type 1 glutamine amidotransferase
MTCNRFISAAAILLCAATAAAQDKPPVRVLLVTGRHSHDWKATTAVLQEGLAAAGRFQVEVVDQPELQLTPERLAACDAVLFHYRSADRWPSSVEEAFAGAIRGGKGLVVFHHAGGSFAGRTVGGKASGEWPAFGEMVGGGRRPPALKPSTVYQFRVELPVHDHPIIRGLPEQFLHVRDELYRDPKPAEGNTVLATVENPQSDGRHAVAWVRQYGTGRVFHLTLGHGPEAIRGVGFTALLTRGLEWSATGAVTLLPPERMDAPEDR